MRGKNTGRKNRQLEIIKCCNEGNQGVDIYDQMASYFTPLRKTIIWYHGIGVEYGYNQCFNNFFAKDMVKVRHKHPNLYTFYIIYSLAEIIHLKLRSSGKLT